MSEARKGVMAMLAACVVWGLSSMYYKALAHVPALEVLSHRTLWSLVFFACVLALQGRLREVGTLIRAPRALLAVFAAALVISTNWFLFIWSVQTGHAVAASLGYYIFPLVAVALGVLVLGEGLSRAQGAAVALAALAVAVLGWGLGAGPWISLALAGTFGAYGLLKKASPAGPVVSVTTEVLLLSPLALIWLWGVHTQGWVGIVGRNLGAFGTNWHDTLLLMGSGPITAGPLILFSYASKRVGMATVGLVQYVNPTLQFLVAVLVFREALTQWHMIALPMIWTALALYSRDSLRQDRAARSACISAAGVGRTET